MTVRTRLAEYKGDKVAVICEDCELLKNLDGDALLAEYGEVEMPSILMPIARSFGCKRTENSFYDRCRLHYHHSPQEWAQMMGYINPRERKENELRFSDLSRWHRLYVHCNCGRKSEADRERLERSVGKDAMIADAVRKLVCKKCGMKGTAKIIVRSPPRD
ncbi:hypothetical protein [Rhizobium sp. WW_1]|jgi:hypothetical protein|uniref:hypothetical protein n=1 Tax=Rhizobium sp. WW_1 TaxID=1907375 RepID=UPI0006469F90|nr:hypothetical protein [Rhizobium sp. WW_1]RKD61575.1 hypothetical protein BJ928_107176 [Rhizobium sp. WW_1]